MSKLASRIKLIDGTMERVPKMLSCREVTTERGVAVSSPLKPPEPVVQHIYSTEANPTISASSQSSSSINVRELVLANPEDSAGPLAVGSETIAGTLAASFFRSTIHSKTNPKLLRRDFQRQQVLGLGTTLSSVP